MFIIIETSTKEDKKLYEDIVAEDAQVCSDITANVIDRIKFFIRDSQNTYTKMQKNQNSILDKQLSPL